MTTILTKPPEGLSLNCFALSLLKAADANMSQKSLAIDFNRTIYGAEVPMLLELNIWEELSNLLFHIPDRLSQKHDVEITCSLQTLHRLLAIKSKALETLDPSHKNCDTFYIHLPAEDDAINKAKYLLIALFKDHIVGNFNVESFRIPLEMQPNFKKILENTPSLRLEPKVKILFTREYVLAHEDKNSLEFNIGKGQKLCFIFEQGVTSANSKALQIPLNNVLRKHTFKDISNKHLLTTAQEWSETAFKNRFQDILKKSEKEQNKECETLLNYLLKSKDSKNEIAMIFRIFAEIGQENEISKFLYAGIKTMIGNRVDPGIMLMLLEEFTFLFPPHEIDLFKKFNTETTHHDRAFSLINFAYDKSYFGSFPEILTAYTNYFQRKMIKDNSTNSKGLEVDKDKIVSTSQKFFLRLIQGQDLHGKKTPPHHVNLYKALHLLRWVQAYPQDCKLLQKGFTIVKMYEKLIDAAEPYMCLPIHDKSLQVILRETVFKLSYDIPKEVKKEIYTLEFNAAYKAIKRVLNDSSEHKLKLEAIRLFVVLLNKHQEHFTTKQSINMALDMFQKLLTFTNSEYQVSVMRFLLLIIDNYGADRTVTVSHYAELLKTAKSTPNYTLSAISILKDIFDAYAKKRILALENKVTRHYPSEMEILMLELTSVLEVAKHSSVVANDELSDSYKHLWKGILKAIFVLKEQSLLTQKMDFEIIPAIQNLIVQYGDLELSDTCFSEMLEIAKTPDDTQRLIMWMTWLCCLSGKTEILTPESIDKHVKILCKKANDKKLLSEAHSDFIGQLSEYSFGFHLPQQEERILTLFETLAQEFARIKESSNGLESAVLFVALQLINRVQHEPQLLKTFDLSMIYKTVASGALNNISEFVFGKSILHYLHTAWKELPNEFSKKKELYDIQFDVAQEILLTKLTSDHAYWKGRFAIQFLELMVEYTNYYDNETTKQMTLKLFNEGCKTGNPYLLGMLPNFVSVLEFVETDWNTLKAYHEDALQACENNPDWIFGSTPLSMLYSRHAVNKQILNVMREVSVETTGTKNMENSLEAELQWKQLKSATTIIEKKEVKNDKLLTNHYENLINEMLKYLTDIGSEDLPPLKKINQITPALKYFILELKTLEIPLLCVDLFVGTLKANSKELDNQLVEWMKWLYEQGGMDKIFTTEQTKTLLSNILERARKLGAFKDGSTGLEQANKIVKGD